MQERDVNFDATTDPHARSWRPVPSDSDFPVQNLPYGAFERDGSVRLGVALGDAIFDLRVACEAGLFDDIAPHARAMLAAPTLGALLERGAPTWHALRARIAALLAASDTRLRDAGLADTAFVPRVGTRMHLAFDVGDFIDFYSSLQHATNAGRIFRPGAEPIAPNWRAMPIGYHGRTASIVPSGTPIVRPHGQRRGDDGAPTYAPTRALDFELELAFVTGAGPEPPERIDARRARETIFGVALLDDWSARDVQAWESQPLGPLLGKSFATSLGDWIVTLDALEPYRVAGPTQEPEPLAYLKAGAREAFDIELDVTLASQAMRAAGSVPQTIVRANFREHYWSFAQQLAHATSNGARVRAGDLFGTGTISGEAPGAWGSLLETTWRGTRPFALGERETRAYLEDGDEIVMRAWCAGAGRARVGFGSLSGIVTPARAEVDFPA